MSGEAPIKRANEKAFVATEPPVCNTPRSPIICLNIFSCTGLPYETIRCVLIEWTTSGLQLPTDKNQTSCGGSSPQEQGRLGSIATTIWGLIPAAFNIGQVLSTATINSLS